MSLVLTLHYPKGARGIPLYTSSNPHLLHVFKRYVLEEWRLKAETAQDDMEALIARAEYDRLKRLLNVLLPNGEGGGQAEV
jgi:hypothetical protein